MEGWGKIGVQRASVLYPNSCYNEPYYIEVQVYVVHSHSLRIPAPTRSLKSSKVGADITEAGRPFQRRTVDGKKDPLYPLIEQYTGRKR